MALMSQPCAHKAPGLCSRNAGFGNLDLDILAAASWELLTTTLANMPESQRRAVELWAHSASFGDIAKVLDETPHARGPQTRRQAERQPLQRLLADRAIRYRNCCRHVSLLTPGLHGEKKCYQGRCAQPPVRIKHY